MQNSVDTHSPAFLFWFCLTIVQGCDMSPSGMAAAALSLWQLRNPDDSLVSVHLQPGIQALLLSAWDVHVLKR
jgi:hypothetical protein